MIPETAPRNRTPIVMGVVLVVVLLFIATGHLLSVVVAVVVIAAVIMLHETGHFVVAKLSGMKATEFFLGFGPRVWSTQRGETEYGVKAIPIGGYVRIIGMNNLEQVDELDEPRSYRSQTFPRRLGVAVAGSAVHFALALIAAWSLFALAPAKSVPRISHLAVLSGGQTAAQRAGLQAGDVFVAYDSHPTNGHWLPVYNYIHDHANDPIDFTVLRKVDGRTEQVSVVATPADASTVIDQGQPISTQHTGFLGINVAAVHYSILGSIPKAFQSFWDDGVMASFHGLAQVFSPSGLSSIGHQVVSPPGSASAASAASTPRLTSVIGIVNIAGQLPGWPDKVFLFLEANVFVGLFNLFPILPFDGGHVAIAVYERIRSRRGKRYKADVTKMLPFAFGAIVLIGFVFVSSLYLDIVHPITLH